MESKPAVLSEYLQALHASALGLVACLASSAALADARIAFVRGEVVQPEYANQGDEIAFGTVIETGADGLVIVEQTWRSDQQYVPCVQYDVIGASMRRQIIEGGTAGSCQTTTATDKPATNQYAKHVRYGDAPVDIAGAPEKVRRSHAEWRDFQSWMQTATRSYAGTLKSYDSTSVTVVNPSTGQRRKFVRTSVLSQATLDKLMSAPVRIDYEGNTATGIHRIGLKPAPAPKSVPKPSLKPLPKYSPKAPPKPAPKPAPQPPDSPDGPTGNVNGEQVGWTCELDMHDGERAILALNNVDGRLSGKFVTLPAEKVFAVSGRWRGSSVVFHRQTGQRGRQPFFGSAFEAKSGAVRMAGRFNSDYGGVWSADCRLGWPTPDDMNSAAADQKDIPAIGYGDSIVLTRVHPDKVLATIKTVRALTGLGLKESKEATENLPFVVGSDLDQENIRRIAGALREVEAEYEIR